MSTNVETGDRAIFIGGTDGLNLGKIVRVGIYAGEHSKLGIIWHVHSLGRPLVTEFGAVGMECDAADRWLKKLPRVDEGEVRRLYAPSPKDEVYVVDDQSFVKAA